MSAIDGKQQTPTLTAHQVNVTVAKQVSDLVKTTLGPYGMDKEMVDVAGVVVTTNDGATILKETKFNHPTAQMIIEVARTQEENCYDGTTTSVVITGELMDKGEVLLDMKIHPTRIAKGYILANEKAQELLSDISVEATDSLLLNVAKTAMTGKSAESAQDILAQICVDVAKSTSLDNINIVRRTGGKVSDSVAISGLLIDREKSHHNMPNKIEDAKIALIDVDITLPEFAQQLQIQVADNAAVKEFIESRKEQLHGIAQNIIDSGANVVFCGKDIDRLVMEYFAKYGVYAARRVARSDLEALSTATNARLVSSIDELTEFDLGLCGLVEEISVGKRPLIKLTDTKTTGAVSVLIRAPTQTVVDEVCRAFDDAIGSVSIAMEDNMVVAGGGAPYMHLSKELKEYAFSIGGREQLAVNAFAEALEVIPKALAENSGIDPVDTLIALRQVHSTTAGFVEGVDVENGGNTNMLKKGVVEPVKVVSQAIDSATSIASQLLRIDNIIEKRGSEGETYGL